MLLALQLHDPVVESLDRQRVVLGDARHRVRRRRDVRVAEDDEDALRSVVYQAQLGPEDRHERALAADQGSRDVEAVLREQRVQAVTGHPPRNAREAGPDRWQVPVAQRPHAAVQLGLAPTTAQDVPVLVVSGPAHPRADTVVREHLLGARR